MVKYQWKVGGPIPGVDAEVFGEIVERIASKNPAGVAPPAAIVEAAKSRSSAIHRLFNWNDREAADAHREQQARMLVGRLQIVRVETRAGPAVSARAFYSVRTQEQRGYAPTQKIMSNRDLRMQVIGDARRDLDAFISRYAGALVFGNFIERLQAVLDEMRDECDRLALEAGARRPGAAAPGTAEHQTATS